MPRMRCFSVLAARVPWKNSIIIVEIILLSGKGAALVRAGDFLGTGNCQRVGAGNG